MIKIKIGQHIIFLSAVFVFLFLFGCGANYSGYHNEGGKAYYDQYVDRPGYYDFGRPVIFTNDGGRTAP